MITFETYKKCAKEWYAKNKSEKKCPSDKKLMEWFKDFSMNEKSTSKKQRAFFNVVHDMKTGEKEPSGKAGEVAKNMKKSDIEDFAFTSNKEIEKEKKKTDEGIGISKTVRKGKNSKTPNYKKRSKEHVRESANDLFSQIKSKFGAAPKGADLRDQNGQAYVYYYGDNPKAKAWAMKVKKAFPNGVVYVDTAQMEEGSNLSLANKKGMNAKPKNRRKKINEAQLRSYITERLKKLDQLQELHSQKKKIVENLTADEMQNLFMVMDENYPAGAKDDPNAPWNQEEPRVHQGTVSKKKLTQVAGDPNQDMLVQDESELYVISRENLNNDTEFLKDLQFNYGTVPIEDEESDYEGGGVFTSYNWDEATLDVDDLLNAAGDYILRGDLGSPEEYESGEHFVYKLTPEMAKAIWSVSSPLEQVPQVQRMINYKELREKYPDSF